MTMPKLMVVPPGTDWAEFAQRLGDTPLMASRGRLSTMGARGLENVTESSPVLGSKIPRVGTGGWLGAEAKVPDGVSCPPVSRHRVELEEHPLARRDGEREGHGFG